MRWRNVILFVRLKPNEYYRFAENAFKFAFNPKYYKPVFKYTWKIASAVGKGATKFIKSISTNISEGCGNISSL